MSDDFELYFDLKEQSARIKALEAEVADLRGKLAEAVGALDWAQYHLRLEDVTSVRVNATLAKLKGEKQ